MRTVVTIGSLPNCEDITLKTVIKLDGDRFYMDAQALQDVHNALYHFNLHPENWELYRDQPMTLFYGSPTGTKSQCTLEEILRSLGVRTHNVKNVKKRIIKKFEVSAVTWSSQRN